MYDRVRGPENHPFIRVWRGQENGGDREFDPANLKCWVMPATPAQLSDALRKGIAVLKRPRSSSPNKMYDDMLVGLNDYLLNLLGGDSLYDVDSITADFSDGALFTGTWRGHQRMQLAMIIEAPYKDVELELVATRGTLVADLAATGGAGDTNPILRARLLHIAACCAWTARLDGISLGDCSGATRAYERIGFVNGRLALNGLDQLETLFLYVDQEYDKFSARARTPLILLDPP